MREQPGAAELLDGVAEFMTQELMPRLSGRAAFHTRIAINVLAIVRREMMLGPAASAREAARLAELLGAEGDAEALTAALCERIAHGEIDANDPKMIEHLWATTLDTVAIDQPNYATYRRATGAEQTAADAEES
jgi:Domain of unknown function (DUF6285)